MKAAKCDICKKYVDDWYPVDLDCRNPETGEAITICDICVSCWHDLSILIMSMIKEKNLRYAG